MLSKLYRRILFSFLFCNVTCIPLMYSSSVLNLITHLTFIFFMLYNFECARSKLSLLWVETASAQLVGTVGVLVLVFDIGCWEATCFTTWVRQTVVVHHQGALYATGFQEFVWHFDDSSVDWQSLEGLDIIVAVRYFF